MEKTFYQPGDRVKFKTLDIGKEDWEQVDIPEIMEYDGKIAEIDHITLIFEPGNRDYEYYDIRFSDGKYFEGISGYHLIPLLTK